MQLFLTALGILFFALFYFSFRKVRNSGEVFGMIYHWMFWMGSFVWEDLMIFSLYHGLATALALIFQDVRIFVLMIGVFWVIRSAGEAIYFFLQQFHLPQHYPHQLNDFFAPIRKIFGPISDQKSYIILQVIHQSNAMIATTGTALLLLNWQNVPAWF